MAENERGGRWLRLETTWSSSGWVAPLEPESRLCWVELLCYVKAHGMDGRAKALPVNVASRYWGVTPVSVTAMLEAASAGGDEAALRIQDGYWEVVNWKKYQGDRTAAERAKRYRESRAVTRDARYNRDVTPTGTRTEEEESKKGTPELHRQGGAVDNLSDIPHSNKRPDPESGFTPPPPDDADAAKDERTVEADQPPPTKRDRQTRAKPSAQGGQRGPARQTPAQMIADMAYTRDVPWSEVIARAGGEPPWDAATVTMLRAWLQPLPRYSEEELDARRRARRATATRGDPSLGPQQLGDILRDTFGPEAAP